KIVARDARGRNAHPDRVELTADRVEDFRAERLVRRIAAVRDRDVAVRLRVDLRGDLVNLLAHVDEGHRAHLAPRQFHRDRAAYSTPCSGYYGYFSCDFHRFSRWYCCTAT